MDKIERYRQILQQIVTNQAEYSPSHGEIETLPICDTKQDNYLLVDVGWDQTGRVYSVIAHLSLREGKIWVERDGLERGITRELLEAGIPQEDIELAFYRPERRALVDFTLT
mgnify:CR=1 FL=1